MGTWAMPVEAGRIDEFEALMAEPLPARTACDALYSVMGDDSLFDSISDAGAVDPAADVRGIVAATLEEWIVWSGADGTVGGIAVGHSIRERLEKVLEAAAPLAAEGAARDILTVEDEAGARMAVAWACEIGAADVALIDVAEATVPGIWVARTPKGEVVRVDGYAGVVSGPYPAAEAAVAGQAFGADGPRP